MKLDDILAKFVTLVAIVFVGWYAYISFLRTMIHQNNNLLKVNINMI